LTRTFARPPRLAVGSPATLAAAAFFVALVAAGVALEVPWLPVDELEVVASARELGGGSAGAGVVFPLLFWAPAQLLSPGAFLVLAKVVAALASVATLVPAYALARRVAEPRLAAAAAALAVGGPAALYGAAALPDTLGLLLATSSLAAASGGRRRSTIVLAALAALTRPWFLPLPFALWYALASREERARLTRWPWAATFAAAAGAAYAAYEWSDAGSLWELVRSGGGSLALAAVAVGVVPWVLAWVRDDAAPLRGLLWPTAVAAAVGAAFAGAGGESGVDERPALVLVPLVLALAAGGLQSGYDAARARLAAFGTVLVFVLLPWPLHEADGGALAAALVRHLPSHALLVIFAAALALAPALRPASTRPALAAAAAVVVAGAVAAWVDAADTSRSLRIYAPSPRSSVDEAAGSGSDVTWILLPKEGDPRGLAEAQLWNRSIRRVRRVDPERANPATGALGSRRVGLALASALATGIGGSLVGRTPYGSVLRLDGPPRAAEVVVGRYTDGWSGGETTYRRFAGSAGESTLTVTASRRLWAGADKPGRVVVDVTTASGAAFSERVARIHAGREVRLVLPVPAPPFQAIVRITPTFSPAELGGSDPRQLGAVLTFAYGS